MMFQIDLSSHVSPFCLSKDRDVADDINVSTHAHVIQCSGSVLHHELVSCGQNIEKTTGAAACENQTLFMS